ncbi:MAG TPA: serine protease [Firmicutes bacterium]|nr:serine protease [Bacillota bacterium]
MLGYAGAALAADDVREAIVKVYAVHNPPDYYNPWNMEGPSAVTGSGCIIEGNRILTNAHVVSDQTFLQVRRYGEADLYQARVAAVSHEVDLALLEVDDPSFFKGVKPLELGDLPEIQERVLVYGFPMGGDTLSITGGVISRIEHQPYVHSSLSLLAGQIDAAINPGNSGGPVIVEGKVVGVIMQGIPEAQNIGYMVPAPVIKHFLEDIKDGTCDGFPSLGILMQNMRNPDLRRRYKMADGQTGALVTRVLPGSPADGKIRPGDVLLSVDGYQVANDGTVEFRPKERTALLYVIQRHQLGEEVTVEVLRDGQVVPLRITLNCPWDRNLLVPMEQYDKLPSYYIYGGIVFCPLSKNLLKIWGDGWYNMAPKELVAILSDNVPEVEGEQVVVILRVLPADVNDGYQDMVYSIVKKVNGKRIRNMNDLVRFTEEDNAGPYTVFETKSGEQIVLSRDKVRQSRDRILSTYKIREDRSADLKSGLK